MGRGRPVLGWLLDRSAAFLEAVGVVAVSTMSQRCACRPSSAVVILGSPKMALHSENDSLVVTVRAVLSSSLLVCLRTHRNVPPCRGSIPGIPGGQFMPSPDTIQDRTCPTSHRDISDTGLSPGDAWPRPTIHALVRRRSEWLVTGWSRRRAMACTKSRNLDSGGSKIRPTTEPEVLRE
jgi:hypothetical protein